MKKFLIVLIIIFICGILSADICLKEIADSEILVGIEFYKQFSNSKLVFKDVFWSILYERIKLFGFLVILCFTPLKEKAILLLAPLFTFLWGFFLMSSIMELGVAGLVVGLASVLPHGVLYIGMLGLLLMGRVDRRYHVKNQIGRRIGEGVVVVLLFLTGCIVESLVGTHFIPWVIRLSFI